MVAPAPATRRHTTGSTAKHHHHRFQNFGAQFHPTEDVTALGDAALALQSDIAAASEQVRRERQSKRAKQQAQAEAEAALTRTDTRGTRGTREDDDSKPLVGNLIGEGHVNYVLMYNMLTGIRIGVSRWQAKLKKPLTDDDFTGKHKYSFDM
jgi:1-phosphatidylinositol-4-phosphate 5-kinase